MGKYIELTSANFDATTKEGVSLVDFCCKVNTDEEQDLAVKYGIRSIPTIIFMKNGEVVDQLIGATSKQALTDKINSLL